MQLIINIMFSTIARLKLLLLALFLWSQPASADKAPFLGTDPTGVSAAGEMTLQQWFSWANGSTGASFNNFESQSEFDYGLSDRLQLGLSVLYDWERTRPPGDPAEIESRPGFAGEIIYVVIPIDNEPFGLSLAFDPAIDAHSKALAFRLLLEKRIGRFQHVLNINFDNEWEKDAGSAWHGTSGIAMNYGLGYALDRNWTVALEIGNELDFDELLIGGRLKAATNTVFAGPTLQYDCELAVITFGLQAQLPLSMGNHTRAGFTDDAERWRAGVRLTRGI